MKRAILTVLLGIFLVLALSSFALADLSISDVKLGGSDQERSSDEDKVYDDATFILTNTGNTTITGINIAGSADSKYNITLSGFTNGFSLNPNDTKTITIRGIIPIDLDAADGNGNKIQVDVGDITVTSSVPEVKKDIFMEAENKLEIKKATVVWDGQDERVDNGDTVNDIKPGQSIELQLVIENIFDSSGDYDFDIQDVEAKLDIDNSFDVDDDNIDVGDIKAEDETEANFIMDVETDADEKTYNVVIMVVGEDENGARHGEKWTVKFDVAREKEDIKVKTAEFLPETVSCERTARLDVKIENVGSRDSDDIVLTVECDELNYKEKLVNIDLNSEDDYSKSFTINLNKEIKAGVYICSVKTYFDATDYNDDDYNDVKDVTLTVNSCETTTPTTPTTPAEEEEEPIIVQPQQPPTTPTTPTGGVVYGQPVAEESVLDDFFGSNAFIAVIAVGALIGIALLFLAIAVLVRR